MSTLLRVLAAIAFGVAVLAGGFAHLTWQDTDAIIAFGLFAWVLSTLVPE